MTFTIVIPSRLNSATLKSTLSKILKQTYQDYEVLVILDFEDENLMSNEKIKYLFSGIKSPGEKRNMGILKSNSKYIAFLDDDAYPDADWLKNAKELLDNNSEYTGVCGPSVTPPESEYLEKIGGYIFESILTSGPTKFRHVPSAHRYVDDYPTVNLILRKYVLDEIGGFDNNFWPGEDTKLCHDITVKFGKKIYYSPLLVVYHSRRNIFHPHLIQVTRYATHRGFFVKKFPRTSLRLSYFIPSIFVLYIIFLPIFIKFAPKFYNFIIFPLIIYIVLLGIDSAKVYLKSKSFAASILTACGIFFSNFSYGIFFIKGLFSKPELVLREVDFVNEKYIKG